MPDEERDATAEQGRDEDRDDEQGRARDRDDEQKRDDGPSDVTPKEENPSLREQGHALRDDLSSAPRRVNETLEERVRERPLLQHLLDLGVVARAVLIAAVVALIVWLLIGPAAAAVALLVFYFGGWYVLARRSYSRRRPTRPADEGDDADAGERSDTDSE